MPNKALWTMYSSINFTNFLQAAITSNLFIICPDWICFFHHKVSDKSFQVSRKLLKKFDICQVSGAAAPFSAKQNKNTKFSKVFQKGLETRNWIFWLCDEKTNSIRTNKEYIEAICRPFEIIPTYSSKHAFLKRKNLVFFHGPAEQYVCCTCVL